MLLLGLIAAAKIAVLDVRTGAGVDPALSPYLTQVLAQEIAARAGQAPVVSGDLTAMLGFEKNKKMLGCSEDDSSCLAEISGALGVAQVLATSVAVSGEKYLLTMTLLDARRATPLKRAAESAPHEDEALQRALRRAAWQIFGGAEPVQAPPPESFGRRGWSFVALGGAALLAIGGSVAGTSALAAARDGNSGTAKPRAHFADALFIGAAVCAGAGAYLYFSARPGGGALALRVRW